MAQICGKNFILYVLQAFLYVLHVRILVWMSSISDAILNKRK